MKPLSFVRSAGLCVLALELSMLSPAQAVTGYQKLVAAIKQANLNGQSCKLASGCLGKPVSVLLEENVNIEGTLPPLNTSAHLSIRGACPREANGFRCIIDGQSKFRVFSGFFLEGYVPVSLLELDNLIFQNAKGGVLYDMWTNVVGTNLIFRNNILPSIGGAGRSAYPSQVYTNCRFNYNKERAIFFGNSKFGLSLNRTGLYVKNSIFYKNDGPQDKFDVGGGAVYVAGYGTAIFENVKFDSNTALMSGGAIYASTTKLILRNVNFTNNEATQGRGGAVAGESYIYGGLQVSFCSCNFGGNRALANKKSDNLFFQSAVPEGFTPTKVTVNFCDTPIPLGSVFPAKVNGTVNSGTGSNCSKKYC